MGAKSADANRPVRAAGRGLHRGGDPQMRRLAQEVMTDQQSEIALMQLWLKRHTRQ
jgi:uncharacterized protein (DUF305 family)